MERESVVENDLKFITTMTVTGYSNLLYDNYPTLAHPFFENPWEKLPAETVPAQDLSIDDTRKFDTCTISPSKSKSAKPMDLPPNEPTFTIAHPIN